MVGPPVAGTRVSVRELGGVLRGAPVCPGRLPRPSRGCAVRATPEGTPTPTTVLLTAFDACAGRWG